MYLGEECWNHKTVFTFEDTDCLIRHLCLQEDNSSGYCSSFDKSIIVHHITCFGIPRNTPESVLKDLIG